MGKQNGKRMASMHVYSESFPHSCHAYTCMGSWPCICSLYCLHGNTCWISMSGLRTCPCKMFLLLFAWPYLLDIWCASAIQSCEPCTSRTWNRNCLHGNTCWICMTLKRGTNTNKTTEVEVEELQMQIIPAKKTTQHNAHCLNKATQTKGG